jgi:hypothetical protein
MDRYSNIANLKTERGRRYKSNPIYPSIPKSIDDFYIISTVGDRYDTLALKFYGDSKLWWIIASANNMTKASLVTEPGIQIRIPGNKQQAILLYNQINQNR